MTALEQYIRLETEALWHEKAGSEPRQVIVSFGNASLVITNISDAALAHWTLAATRIVGREGDTVIYAPDANRSETLRISDTSFVDAIEAVSASTTAVVEPKRWKLKTAVSLVAVALVAVLLFVPQKISGWAAGHVSPEQLVLVTDEILDRASIKYCNEPRAVEALNELQAMMLRPQDAPIYMTDIQAEGIVRLPDGRALIDISVLKRAGSADGFAGWLVLAVNMPDTQDGLDELIRNSDTGWALRFAFSGEVSDQEYQQMAEYSLHNATLPNPDAVAAALDRLENAGIDTSSFRKSINLPLEPEIGPFRPVLGDQDWLALQTICGL